MPLRVDLGLVSGWMRSNEQTLQGYGYGGRGGVCPCHPWVESDVSTRGRVVV